MWFGWKHGFKNILENCRPMKIGNIILKMIKNDYIELEKLGFEELDIKIKWKNFFYLA